MGTLYGVSVGSGDYELMTLKAVGIIGKCRVIAAPRTNKVNSLALSIAEKAIDLSQKEIVFADFSMSGSTDYNKIAEQLYPYLDTEDVAMLCIGDVSVYSTFSYVAEIAAQKGYIVEYCAGVTSFCAAAAEMKRPLVQGEEALLILPYSNPQFDWLMNTDTSKVIMKCNRNIADIKPRITGEGYAVENCGLDNQRKYNSIDEIGEDCGYFTTIFVNKQLRRGYTTGSCAAAAAKAAAEMLMIQSLVDSVSLMTPKGIMLELAVLNAEINEESASCAIKKDGGDDPDVTSGLLIYAKVCKRDKGVRISGGKGVGTVTERGLDQPVGEAAINSVPRMMITDAVREIADKYDYCGGFDIEISVPQGEQAALKTFNSRLGIKGGISIIGTSGIVEPMSNPAIIETIRAEQNMRRANGEKNLVLISGGYGNKLVSDKRCRPVTCSNFIGESIDIALELSFESIIICGHIGKLIKLGAGIMNTHSSQADGRMETLITCGVLAGFDNNILKSIPECVTVDAALEVMREHDGSLTEKALRILAERVQYYLDLRVRNAVRIGAVMFSEKHDILIKTSGVEESW